LKKGWRKKESIYKCKIQDYGTLTTEKSDPLHFVERYQRHFEILSVSLSKVILSSVTISKSNLARTCGLRLVKRFEDKFAFILEQDEIKNKLDCMNAEFKNNITCMNVL